MKSAQTPIRSSTQEFLEIEDIRDDLVILKDGSCVLTLGISAINFGLLSEEEQEATIYAYASLLNSLSFPIQIVILSKRMDISSYLSLIAQREGTESSEKIRAQLRKYYQFIQGTVKENRVLEKRFYIVIPFSAIELGVKGAWGALSQRKTLPFPKDYILARAKTSLFPKRDHLLRQLSRLGLKAEQLTTQGLIELFYSLYNPGAVGAQKPTEAQGYTQPLVQSFTSFPPPATAPAKEEVKPKGEV